MPFSIRGPKGRAITHSMSATEIAKKLPAFVKKYRTITVGPAEKAKAKPEPDTTAKTRAAIVAFCRWSIQHEKDWHYAQERPMERLKTPTQLKKLPREADCSEHATDAYAFAGAPDPNGMDYAGSGYTGTMLEHCRHINKQDAQPGDLVVFGPGSGDHVCVLLEDGTANGGDPLVCSHGQERGPIEIRLSAEAAAQSVPVTFLTCLD